MSEERAPYGFAECIVHEMKKKGRVCLMPIPWGEMYTMLPNTKKTGNGWCPSAPLISASWYESTDAIKTKRFVLHLEWAMRNGATEVISNYLDSLCETDWHHHE